jgi:uncharacterized membrane protein
MAPSSSPAAAAAPPGGTDTVLFEAVCTPPRSAVPGGLGAVAALLALPSAGFAALFAHFGAWPVMGFMGGELALVLALFSLHRRRSAREMEVVLLTPERLTVTRIDGRGRRAEATLQPYWSRLDLRERAGGTCELWLSAGGRTGGGRAVEVGRCLGDADRRSLAEALASALRSYREPRFDNPQLRDGG